MNLETQKRPAAEVTAEHQDKNTLRVHDTTTELDCQARLMDALQIGAENATSTAALLALTGISNRRELRRIVAKAREGGAVILSDCRGYWIPSEDRRGQEEAAAFVELMTNKGVATLRAADSARQFLRRDLPGQITVTGAETGGGDDG